MPYLGTSPSAAAAGTLAALATVGDGTAEDTRLVFDGNALDFRMGIDDGTDTLEIGKGNAHGTTAHMIFDTNGIIRAPLQPLFRAQITGGDQTNVNGLTTITFNSEDMDVNADFNTGTYTFTAPVTGMYLFSQVIKWKSLDTAAAYYESQFTTSNGNLYMGMIDPNFSADLDFYQMNGTIIETMDASDTCLVQITASGGTAQADIDSGESFFSGFLVG